MCFELRSWLRSLALGFFLSMAFGVMLCLAEGPAMAEGSGNLPLTIIEVDRLSEQYGKEARYTELIRLGRQALEQGMEFLALHQRMAMAYRALGRFEGAVSHDQRALKCTRAPRKFEACCTTTCWPANVIRRPNGCT